jgi:zinc protease
MNKLTRHLSLAALAAVTLAGPAAAQVRDYRDIKTPALRKVTMPQPKRVQLANGMVVLLMEDHELPLIRGTARIRGGGREVAADKTGLSGILGQSWRTGGTTSRTGDQLDEFLESRAAIVETSANDDSMSVTLNVLKNDFDTVFPIFVDLMRNPAFRQEKIDLAKTQANTVISRRNDEPGAILQRETVKLGYGADSPYARQAEYATIASITRDDLLAFHKKFVHPNNIVLGFVGDFDTAQMEKKLRDAFASWPKGPQAPKPTAAINPARGGVYFVAKDDVNQSNISFVHAGTTRNNPDYAAIQVLNEILNAERLFPRIRTQQGLAYSVGGFIGADWDRPGLFVANMGTKSGTTLQAVNSLRTELTGLHTAPFTSEEVTRAKESILNAHVFTIDSRLKVLNQSMNLEFYGYPADWYQRYPSDVEKVTIADVARVAKTYVSPDKFATLVVGKEADFDKPLNTLGTVTPIDITIPELDAKPGAAPAAATSMQSTPEGLALMKKVQDFAGGKAALDAVKSVRVVQNATRTMPQGEMTMDIETVTVFPERHRSVIRMPMGEMTVVVTPETAFAILPGMGTRDMPASQRDDVKSQGRQDLITMLKYPERYTFTVAGTEKVNNVDGQILQVGIEGETARWVIDAATGKPLRKIAKGRGPMAQGDQVTDFTDFKTFGGITFPTAFTTTSNGQTVGSGKLTTVEVNPAVDSKAFEKPAA